MLSFEILDDNELIVLTTSGEATFDDMQLTAPQFFAESRELKIRKILLDWQEFEGWPSKDAESLAFHSWTEGRALFDRIALVAGRNSKAEAGRFIEFFENAGKDVKMFRSGQMDQAMEWLKQEG